jgi:hypothetical protein
MAQNEQKKEETKMEKIIVKERDLYFKAQKYMVDSQEHGILVLLELL